MAMWFLDHMTTHLNKLFVSTKLPL
jgi:hypothetical protein